MDAQDRYRQQSIDTASPAQLVQMLYHAGVAATQRAETALAASTPAAAHRDLVRAQDIVHELRVTLDHERGGSLATNLDALYEWCFDQLVEANTTKQPGPLASVSSVLAQLAASWDQLVAEQVAGTEVPVA